MRICGKCQLCCRLLPVKELSKPANTRCSQQRFRKGCANYANRPHSCKLWSCFWLVDEDGIDLPRPDVAHYIIDCMPEFVDAELDGNTCRFAALQIWCDPRYPDAHHCQKLRNFLELRALSHMLAIVRYGSHEGFVLVAPSLTEDNEWLEIQGTQTVEHTAEEIYRYYQSVGVFS